MKRENIDVYEQILLCQSGDKTAIKEFVDKNMGLVKYVANRYATNGVDLEDLKQHGLVGLMEAIQKFDVTKGTKFSTYALYWIQKEISENLICLRSTLSYSRHSATNIYNFFREKERLEKELMRELSAHELADLLGLSYEKVAMYFNCSQLLSLNSPLAHEQNDKDEFSELGAFIESPERVEDMVEKDLGIQDSKKLIVGIFKKANLNDREIFCFVMRHAFDKEEKYKSSEIGNMLGVSRERVRQLIEKSQIKMYNVAKGIKIRPSYECTIYDIFNFRKEEIDDAIKRLDTQSKKVLFLAYGEDFLNPKRSDEWNEEMAGEFYTKVIPAISALIRVKAKEHLKSCETIYDIFKDIDWEIVNQAISKLCLRDRRIIKLMYGNDLFHPEKSVNCTEQIEALFYVNVIDKMEKLIKRIMNLSSHKENSKILKKNIS